MMLTPQEVAEHAFQKASFGGYNMSMVDEFLDQVTADYTTLYKENTALKAKMKILADKVEEYRESDEAMRKTILAAQKMAEQMVADAEAKRDTIVHDAEEEAQEKIQAIRQEVANEQARLAAAQNATSSYIVKLKELYQHEMEYISGLSKLVAVARQADPVSATAELIGSAVEKAVEADLTEPEPKAAPEAEPQETPEPLEENSLYQELRRGPSLYPVEDDEEEEDEDEEDDGEEEETHRLPPLGRRPMDEDDEEDEDDEPTRRIDFNNLKFGKDYEI